MSNIVPTLEDSNNLLLFLSFIFGFVGIEVSANHATEVENPQRNFPIALFSSAILGFIITLLGGLVVASTVPVDRINDINGATQSFSVLLQEFNLEHALPIVALLIAFGAAGQVSTWIVGPVKGIWAAGKKGIIPKKFLQTNQYNVPTQLLIIQAGCISVIGLLFLFFDDVNILFLILTSIAVILYSIMYLIMFIAAIRLRYSHPETKRAYKVPGGNLGMWITSGMGLLCSLSCIFIGFIPPSGLPFSNFIYEVIVITLCLISISAAIFIIKKSD